MSFGAYPFGSVTFGGPPAPAVATGSASVGLATETGTALALGSTRPVGLAVETGVALPLAGIQIRAVGIATETNTALALAGKSIRAVGMATETSEALALSGGPVALGSVYWNPADKNAAIVLSNGNLTASGPGTSFWAAVRANVAHSTGDWYLEVQVGADSTNLMIGLADSTLPLTDGYFPGVTSNSISYGDDGNVGLNGSIVANYGAFSPGDVIMIAFKAGAQKVWFGKNGTWNGDPAANTGGISVSGFGATYPALGAVFGGTATANFGATTFAYSPPTGFNAWDSNPVGMAVETGTALALAGKQIRAVGLATSADTALPLAGVQVRAVGLATGSETAIGLTARQIKAIGAATETSAAQALGGMHIRAVGLAAGAETAIALGSARPAGLATESGSALALGCVIVGVVGAVQETSTALALAAVQAAAVQAANETGEALALRRAGLRKPTHSRPGLDPAATRARQVSTGQRPEPSAPARPASGGAARRPPAISTGRR